MLIQDFPFDLISRHMGPSFLLGNAQDVSIQLYSTILLPTPSPPPLPTSPLALPPPIL